MFFLLHHKYTVFQKNVVSNFLQSLHQMLTDFENSFTIGNSNKLQNKYNTSRHLLKTLLHYHVKHKKVLKSAFALPILDNKAIPNFYDKFVKC